MAGINQTATSLFQGAPTEKLAVADVYNAPSFDMLSSSVDGVKKVLGNVFTSIRAQGLNLGMLAKVISVKDGNFTISQEEAQARLSSILGVNIASLKDLPPQQRLNAISRLTQFAGINTTSLTNQAGDILKVADGISAKDVNGVFSALERVIGKNPLLSAVTDDLAQASFLGSLMEYSTQFGLVDAIDEVMTKYQQGTTTRDYLEYTLVTSYSAAIANGVLATVDSIIRNTGRDKLLAMYPDAVNMLLGGFVFADGATPSDYPAIMAQLVAILNDLDPNWLTTTRNCVTVTKTEPFLAASPDAKTALSYNEAYWNLVLMAPSYPNQDLTALIRQTYPTIAL